MRESQKERRKRGEREGREKKESESSVRGGSCECFVYMVCISRVSDSYCTFSVDRYELQGFPIRHAWTDEHPIVEALYNTGETSSRTICKFDGLSNPHTLTCMFLI